ncbi:MAG: acyl-CoA dehydrogenase family protein [Myxococcota bacterium]|jgi:(2S)-methylsuccinyl-CoA dehydrogenase|nr:acyl-CoA dehydrogenase family protein [Myxococcota bacterium]
MTQQASLEETKQLLVSMTALLEEAVTRARDITEKGKTLDDHQVLTSRIAYASTEAIAAHQTIEDLEARQAEGRSDEHDERVSIAAVGELANNLYARLSAAAVDLGLDDAALDELFPSEAHATARRACCQEALRAIGVRVCETKGSNDLPLDEMHEQVREQVRDFAANEVMPRAEHIHRTDDLVPEELLEGMAELGFFGLSIPEEYGGVEMGNLAMILTTEELSRASLAAAGSLITRPEILAKALLGGGTEEQKQEWLPRLASGEIMAGISVTEPDLGSDVASLKCKAERGTVNGEEGWIINGPKAWCTFAGRADVLALLARTDPDVSKGQKGLSLFIVPKESSRDHEFEFTQPGGGKITGKADATPGYRGMHSYTLQLEDYFVPLDNLVGGDAQLNRGFYLQMAGFAAGRLQTAGRACGLAQACVEETAKYVVDRDQFGQPISQFQLTEYTLGRMAARTAGARAITYAAARAFDEDPRAASTLAAQAKLLACDVAVVVSQEGQVMHGGWGYAEEYPISRYVVDATVLPIFEGVKPILELKVIGRAILAG